MDTLPLAVFAGGLLWFHVSEYVLALKYQTGVTSRSFLISPPYVIAMLAAIAEYVIEARLLGLPKPRPLLAAGAVAAAAGDALRKAAIVTARAAFTHDLARTRRPGHVLVTGGPYAVARHPGYLGFYAFAVGGQVALANPACAAAFAAVCARFFALRVAAEERGLLRFFGDDYVAYARRTRVWLPGVRGVVPYDGGGTGRGRRTK